MTAAAASPLIPTRSPTSMKDFKICWVFSRRNLKGKYLLGTWGCCMGAMVRSCQHTRLRLWSCLNLEAQQFHGSMTMPLDHRMCQQRLLRRIILSRLY
uniref:Uncharacterized protein n=1 Tax=Arundo donax TaxID=35708 RepID=A0A0A9ECS9_ARUDO